MDSEILTNEVTLTGDEVVCERCGEPATIHVEQTVLCSVCYLKKTGGRIIQLDHTGYYP